MVISDVAAVILAATLPVLVLDGEVAAYADALNGQAIQAEGQFAGAGCPTAKAEHISRQDVKIGDHPEIAAAREKVRVYGCGRSAIENINVARLGGALPWKMTFGLPGNPLADMTLQQTAWPQVLSQAAADRSPDCKSVAVRDIYLAARPGHVGFSNLGGTTQPQNARFSLSLPPEMLAGQVNLNAGAAWAEVWPIVLCDKDRTVVVVFIPLRDRVASVFLVVPIWRQIEEHGAGARPAPDS